MMVIGRSGQSGAECAGAAASSEKEPATTARRASVLVT
jgi:hypothetical protein